MSDTISAGGYTYLEPIMLDMDMTVEDYELDMDTGDESLSLDMDSRIEQVIIETGGLPEGGEIGDIIVKRSLEDYDVEWVTPASSAEQDNTRPITAAAVYTEIGNINALLATI